MNKHFTSRLSNSIGKQMKLLLPVLFICLIGFSQTQGDYRTKGTTSLSSASNWEWYNNSAWVNATLAPSSSASSATQTISSSAFGSNTGTSGTAPLTLSAANPFIAVGQSVTGSGIAAGTTVAAISGTSLTLSQVTTTGATASQALTFSWSTTSAVTNIPQQTTAGGAITITISAANNVITAGMVVTGTGITGYATVNSSSNGVGTTTINATLSATSTVPSTVSSGTYTFYNPSLFAPSITSGNTISFIAANQQAANGQIVTTSNGAYLGMITNVSGDQKTITLSNKIGSYTNQLINIGYMTIPNLYINHNVINSSSNTASTIGNVFVNSSSSPVDKTGGVVSTNATLAIGATAAYNLYFTCGTMTIAFGASVVTNNNTNTGGSNILTLNGGIGSNVLTNNGTITFRGNTSLGSTNYVTNINFATPGSTSVTGAGTYTLNNITLNMGTSSSNTLTMSSSMTNGFTMATATSSTTFANNPLTLTNGTLNIACPSTSITPFGGAAGTIIPATAGLTINNSGVTINGVASSTGSTTTPINYTNNGVLTLTAGTVNIGSNSGLITLLNTASTSNFVMNGTGSGANAGILNIYGSFQSISSATVNISGGLLNIPSGGALSVASQGIYHIASGTTYTQSGGTISINSKNANPGYNEYYMAVVSPTITGGTVSFGGASALKIYQASTFYNLTIGDGTNTSAITSTGSITVNNLLTMSTGGTLVMATNNLTSGSITGGSTNAYISITTGTVTINAVPSVGNTVFPIGTTTSYAPLSFTGGTAGANITVSLSNTFNPTVGNANNIVNLQWAILSSAATTPTVTFQYNSTDKAPGYSSTGAVLGVFTNGAVNYTETSIGTISGSNPYTATIAFPLSTTSIASVYGIGNPNSFSSSTGPFWGDYRTTATTSLSTATNWQVNTNTGWVQATLPPSSSATSATQTITATPFGSGTGTSGTAPITLSAANPFIAVGQSVTGTGIQAGTTVAAISGTSLTLSQVTISGATASQALTFSWNTTSTVTGIPQQTNPGGAITITISAVNNVIAAGMVVTGTGITGYATVNSSSNGVGTSTINATLSATSTVPSTVSTGTFTFTNPSLFVTENPSGTLVLASPNLQAANGQVVTSSTGGLLGTITNVSGDKKTITISNNTSNVPTNSSIRIGYVTIPNLYVNHTVSGSTSSIFSTIGNVFVNNSASTNAGTGVVPTNATLAIGATAAYNLYFTCGTMTIAPGASLVTNPNTNTSATNSLFLYGGVGGNVLTNNGTITFSGNNTLGNTNFLTDMNLFTQGSTAFTGSGTFTLNGLTIGSGTTLTAPSAMTLASTFKNSGTFTPGTGTVNFYGSAATAISGNATTFYNLSIGDGTNSMSVTSVALTVNNQLALSAKGSLTMSTNNLTAASIVGGSSTSYISLTSGKVTINAVPSSSNTVFPIGTSTSYAPLTFSGTTNSPNITVGVGSTFTNTPANVNNLVNLQWSIVASTPSTANVTYQYNTANVGSSYSSVGAIILGTYSGGAYTESSLGSVSGSNPFSVTKSSLTLHTGSANLYGIGNQYAFIPTKPAAPSIGAVTYGNQQVSVAFTAPSINGSTPITVYTATSNPGGFTGTGSSSPVTVSGLTNGTAYTFTVTATNTQGIGAASAASASVTPATVPNAPATDTAIADNKQVYVSYTAPSNNGGSAIIDYTITAIPSSGSNIVRTGITANPYTFDLLTNGKSYTFTVAARNIVGTGATRTTNAATPSATTIWNGITWSAGQPDSSQVAIIAGNIKLDSTLSCSKLIVNAGVTFTNNGTLTVTGNMPDTINGTIKGTGTVVFAGTSIQTIIGNVIVNNLTVSNPVGVTVPSGSSLSITGLLNLQSGTLNTSNGNVILKSTSITNSGILGPIGTGAVINGKITVERYIPKGFRAFRDISANGVFDVSNNLWNTWQESGVNNPGYGMFITGGVPDSTPSHISNGYNDANGIDRTLTGYSSAYYYANGWNTVTNTKTTTLNPYQSFRVLIRGDRNFNLDTTPVVAIAGPTILAMQSATTLRATGTPITGDVTFRTTGITNAVTGATYNSAQFGLNTVDSGYTYLANPYACPIVFDSIYNNSSNIKASYYYLDPTVGSTGAWVSYNSLSGYSTNPKSSVALYGKYIQAGQGFLVGNNHSSSPVVVLKESFKTTGSNVRTAVFGTTTPKSAITISLMKNTSNVSMKMDGVVAVFSTQFSNGLGLEDNAKFNNATDNLSISEGGHSYSIDGRLPATTSDVLGINLGQLSGKDYGLVFDASPYTGNGLSPYLVDAYTNKTIALSNGIDTIAFTANASLAATYQNRFTLIFKPAVLPISSIVATATVNGNVATIKWNTVGENGVAKFEVEKSTDGTSFASIGQLAAKNTATASYSATDKDVVSTTFYRIKEISVNETITYSNVVKLTTNNSPLTTIYPNPLVGKKLKVDFNQVNTGNYIVTITNTLGQKVAEQAINHAGGNGTHSISIKQAIAAGIYNVVIRDVNSKEQVFQSTLSIQ